MAIKKSDLYSSLWALCDELRGGMDASQYKDYVLFMLFIKYVSDKYGEYDGFEPPVVIPTGAGFKDMVALKCNSDIGNRINTQVIQPIIDVNSRVKAAQDNLEEKLDAKYPKLTEDEIKTLVVDDKWLTTLAEKVDGHLKKMGAKP
jgi:type I restriction-modification system DNA methylase subunit